MEWWRAYHGAPFDNKWRVVARLANCRAGEVSAIVWAWFDLASQNVTERGRTHSNAQERTTRIEEIAAGYDFEIDLVERITSALEQRGVIVEGFLSAWVKRQPKREDNSSERSKDWRERKRTQTNANDHREEESREEKIKTDSPSDDFESFLEVYPRKVSKGQARKAFLQAIKRMVMPEIIIAGAKRYRDDPKRNPEFTKHAATWINSECWLDEQSSQSISIVADADKIARDMAWTVKMKLRGPGCPTSLQVADLVKRGLIEIQQAANYCMETVEKFCEKNGLDAKLVTRETKAA